MFYKILLLLFYVLNISAIVTVLFQQRKSPTTTLAWIIVLMFAPGIGLIFYLFFGRGFKIGVKRRLKIQEELNKKYNTDRMKENLNFILEDHKVYSSKSGDLASKIITSNYVMTNSLFSKDNSVEIFISAKDKFDTLFNDIKNAKSTINVLYYIIENDELGNTLIELLTQKAEEGLKIKVIYDDLGSFTTPFKMFKKLRKAGGKVKKFSPLFLGSILYANYRNHRKIVVIDGAIAYSGGMNVGVEYLGMDKKVTPWRDTHLKIIGSAAHTFQLIFFSNWYFVTNNESEFTNNLSEEYFPLIPKAGDVGLQIVPAGPDVTYEPIKRSFIMMIYNAKKSIKIQTPYLIPDETVLTALQSAAASGVEVSLIIPKVSDHATVYHVTMSFLEPLLAYGVKIYKYNGFIHAKTIVIDDIISSVGTTNFDIRSFSLHFEVNTFIYDRGISENLSKIHDNDIVNSEMVDRKEYENRSFVDKFIESVLRLLSPLF